MIITTVTCLNTKSVTMPNKIQDTSVPSGLNMLVCTLCNSRQKSLVCYNMGLAGHPQFVFAVMDAYRDTTILDWHDTIHVSRDLYLYTCTPVHLYTPSSLLVFQVYSSPKLISKRNSISNTVGFSQWITTSRHPTSY